MISYIESNIHIFSDQANKKPKHFLRWKTCSYSFLWILPNRVHISFSFFINYYEFQLTSWVCM